ncbi:MAG: phytanoyl-CoA dioxygenase family protein [Planctomycetota bacterium]|nr:phytanoyl-CoA dioxygenase family protein [Planctomycetota bacterium]MDA1141266.1 phytanoyl-CoA dioxygenase family protein [Planctomycetota bacterium]
MSKSAQAEPVLFTDDQVIDFVIQGYLLIEPDIPIEIHERVCSEFDGNGTINVDLQHDPLGLSIFEKSPSLKVVFDDPRIRGASQSLLGPNAFTFGRYCHAIAPGGGGVGWHQDDVNVRHHQLRRLMFLYYPQDVTADMGPTYVVPGTHLLNTPTDRMQTYGNIRGQVPLVVKAGTVAVTHYDIWHTASHNCSDRMRYMVKYYVDRAQEPTGPTWPHNPEYAIPLAMNRMHHEAVLTRGSDYYKERHLRWKMYSHLLGSEVAVVFEEWKKLHPASRPLANVPLEEIQGYIGAPLV